jgi:hypothetical protein
MHKLNLRFMLLFSLSMTLMSCKVENSEDGANNGNNPIPVDIPQIGALGSWANNDDLAEPQLSVEWYIQSDKTTIALNCEFNGEIKTAVVSSASRIQGSILTFLETKSNQVNSGTQICSVSTQAGTSWSYTLLSANTIRLSRAGQSKEFSRMLPIQ